MNILDLRNTPSIRKNMYNNQIITTQEHLNWIKTLENRKDCCYWGIYLNEQLVGSIDLTHIDTNKMFAEWGIFIDEYHPGLGTIIGFLSMEHFIKDLHFKTILAVVHEENKKAYHFYNVKFGYEKAPEYDIEKRGQKFYGLILSDKRWEHYCPKVKNTLSRLYPINSVMWEDITFLNTP